MLLITSYSKTTMGRSTLISLPFLLMLLLAVACSNGGDDPNRVLHLASGPVTEEQLRTAFRAKNNAEGGDILNPLCRASDFSDESTVMEFVAELLGEEASATAEPPPEDVDRMMEIIAEECVAGLGL